MESVTLQKQNGIATITLNRPKRFNSFNREMALRMQAVLEDCGKDETVRAVVITGAGRAFCAGQDIVEITTPELHPGFEAILEEQLPPIILKIRQLEKPVIGAVNGVAAGAGASVALACDVVVASEKASFIQAFSGIGLVPDSGASFLLPRLIGYQKAMALSMLGDKVKATEAERIGMIYKVVGADEFETVIAQLAQRMANMPTAALARTKQLFNETWHNTLEEQIALENKLQIESSETADYAEGVKAFIEKRKPVFKGK